MASSVINVVLWFYLHICSTRDISPLDKLSQQGIDWQSIAGPERREDEKQQEGTSLQTLATSLLICSLPTSRYASSKNVALLGANLKLSFALQYKDTRPI